MSPEEALKAYEKEVEVARLAKEALEKIGLPIFPAPRYPRGLKSMSEQMQGIVEDVINNGKGKGSGLRIAGRKYGVYDPTDTGLDSVAVGTAVSFRFKETEKGGIVYKNVQGKITTLKDGAAIVSPEVSSSSAPKNKGGYRRNGEEGGFPLHPLSYERALDRRNAITAAVALVADNPDWDSDVSTVLKIAKEFEAYTTGDDIRADIDAMEFVGEDD